MSVNEGSNIDSYDKEFTERLNEYEKSVESGLPVLLDANELAEIADYYHMHEQEEKAENALQLALSLSPGAIGPLTYRIHEAFERDDIEAAKEYYAQITETDSPDYVYDWVEILLAQNKEDEAENYLETEIEKIPSSERQDFIVDIAHIYEQWGYYALAMKWICGAQKEDSQDFKEIMAHTLLGLGKFEDSEKMFDELLDKSPYSSQYWISLSNAQLMKGDIAKAVESSEYALAINPDDTEAMLAKANGLSNLGNYEEALKFYMRALTIVPDNCAALLFTGICLGNLNRHQEAIKKLLQAKQKAKEFNEVLLPDINHELALTYCANNEIDEALACIDELDKLGEDKAHVLLIRGHILLNGRRVEEAEKTFKQALEKAAKPAEMLLHIAVSFLENQMVKAAYDLLRRYFQVAPTDVKDGYAYMAMCCYDLKDTKGFLENLDKACKLNPQECKNVFSNVFPEEVAPEEYYNYVIGKINL